MQLTQQVCSLELAKKLKSLNVKQESLFWWMDIKESTCRVITSEDACDGDQCYVPKKWKEDGRAISAFTVAELGVHLSNYVNEIQRGIHRGIASWSWWNKEDDQHMIFDVEADARAALFIHLLEHKIIGL